MKIATPTIHLNGSNAELLKSEYMAAYNTAQELLSALKAIDLNAREYYLQPEPDAFDYARQQSSAHYNAVMNIRKELATIIMAIQEQQ